MHAYFAEDNDKVGRYSEHDSASNLYVTDRNEAMVSTKTTESSVSSLCLLLKLQQSFLSLGDSGSLRLSSRQGLFSLALDAQSVIH